jgi:hypothetical protein
MHQPLPMTVCQRLQQLVQDTLDLHFRQCDLRLLRDAQPLDHRDTVAFEVFFKVAFMVLVYNLCKLALHLALGYGPNVLMAERLQVRDLPEHARGQAVVLTCVGHI